MRTTTLTTWATTAVFALLLTPAPDHAQPPGGGKPATPKPPPDEFRSLVKEVEEAYKAPFEADKDILDELRKQYKNPTPEREAKIFREIRRLYNLTPDQQQAISQELRKAYERPSPELETRLFQAIRNNGRLPLGTVPDSVQAEQSAKLFRGFDRNADGRLATDEMPDTLRDQRQRWDRNGDGFVDHAEYADYYRSQLRSVSDRVASGEISIKLPKGALQPPPEVRPVVPVTPAPTGTPRDALPFAVRFGKLPPGLPDWFVAYDTDQDGQVGLYEWRKQMRSIDEFTPMDRNGDGLIAPDELLRFLADRAKVRAPVSDSESDDPPTKSPDPQPRDKNKPGR